jgi:benzoate-CoA ligase family protein
MTGQSLVGEVSGASVLPLNGKYNATVDLLERNLAEGRSQRPYLVTEEREWSYEEVASAVDAAGAGFLALGLSPGDRVIIATRDRPEFVISFWGAIKAGLVAVPIPQGLATSDIDFMMSDSMARVIVCDASSAKEVVPAAAKTGVECVVVDGAEGQTTLRWSDVCRRDEQLQPAPTSSDDIALWLYTSGTTGLPKAVMHRHRHLRDAPDALAKQVIKLGPNDVVYSASKMFFAYGLGNSVYLPAAMGASVILNQGAVVPARILDFLKPFKPTVLFGVPTFFNGLVQLPDASLPETVRIVVSAGEALSPTVFESFKSKFGHALLDGLGATEALHHFTSSREDDAVAGSAGKPLDGYEVEVRDRDEQPLPEGASGELWVRGPTTFAGYWQRPDLTARAYRGEWMRTGDVVRIVDGRVWHEGRLDDLIKLGGVWVAPGEVEELIREHPDITDVAVVASDRGTGVPTLAAFVISERTDNDDLRKELRELCRTNLARFKVPNSFAFVDELPRTPTGKLRRFVLRDNIKEKGIQE